VRQTVDGRAKGQSSGVRASELNVRDYVVNVITGDETWTFEYGPETKRQKKAILERKRVIRVRKDIAAARACCITTTLPRSHPTVLA